MAVFHIFVSTFEDLVTFFGLFFIVFLRDVFRDVSNNDTNASPVPEAVTIVL